MEVREVMRAAFEAFGGVRGVGEGRQARRAATSSAGGERRLPLPITRRADGGHGHGRCEQREREHELDLANAICSREANAMVFFHTIFHHRFSWKPALAKKNTLDWSCPKRAVPLRACGKLVLVDFNFGIAALSAWNLPNFSNNST